MFQISVKNLLPEAIACDAKNTKLLEILLQHTDIMHACGGKGRCTTCKVRILSGYPSPEQLTIHEQRFRSMGQLKAEERLSCQIVCNSSLELEIPDSSKLPHLTYVY